MTLQDLFADLVWPMLLRAAGLALRPARLGIALFFLAAVGVLLWVADWIDTSDRNVLHDALNTMGEAVVAFAAACTSLNTRLVVESLHAMFFDVPAGVLSASWWVVILIGLPIAWLVSVAGGAICRSVAVENARAGELSWTRALGFGLAKWPSSFGALITPKIVVWIIILGLTIAGVVLLTVPVVNLLGGLAFGLALAAGFVAVVVMVVYMLVWPMLVPAVACDGADAIDSMQRAYSYAFAKPIRLLLYLFILGVEFVIVMFVAGLLATATVSLTKASASMWMDEDGRAAAVVNAHPLEDPEHGLFADDAEDAHGVPPPAIMYWQEIDADQAAKAREAGEVVVTDTDDHGTPDAADDEVEYKVQRKLDGASLAAHRMIRFWCFIPAALVTAYGFSFLFTGATLLYLAMRKVCDGQDPDEIWMPEARDGVAGKPPSSTTTTPLDTSTSESIADDGPADEG